MSYRIVNYFEECAVGLCLSCDQEFILFDNDTYEYCPRCGEKTSPVKRNKRWIIPNSPNNWELDNNGNICKTYSPHLILEVQRVTTQSLHPTSFAAILHPPKKLPWHLYQHTRLGSTINDCSASVYFVNLFNKIASEKTYDHVRLRLMDGTVSKTIKEK